MLNRLQHTVKRMLVLAVSLAMMLTCLPGMPAEVFAAGPIVIE